MHMVDAWGCMGVLRPHATPLSLSLFLPQVIVGANDTGGLPCTDSFTNTLQRTPMLATVPDVSGLPDPSATLTISTATTAVASYLLASGSPNTWPSINDLTSRLFAFLGVDYSSALPGLGPAALIQPMELARNSGARFRALGVALMAVEAQVSKGNQADARTSRNSNRSPQQQAATFC